MSKNLAAICIDEEPHSGHYKFPLTIGQGRFAKVSLVWHTVTKTEVVVKAIPKQGSYRLSEVH